MDWPQKILGQRGKQGEVARENETSTNKQTMVSFMCCGDVDIFYYDDHLGGTI